MKKNIFYCLLLSCALCASAETTVSAQGLKTLNSAKTAVKASDAALAASNAVLPAASASFTARMATRYQRPLVALQKKVGINTFQAVRNVRAWGAEYIPTHPRPTILPEQAFTVTDLTEFSGTPAFPSNAPQIPFQNQRRLIYRGMALKTDGLAIRNILKNGLLVKDMGGEANTLLLAISNPRAHNAVTRRPLINLTDNANDAFMWANLRMRPGMLRVVAVVESQEKGRIITTGTDIPPQNIYALITLLKINGKLTWCKLELEGNNLRVTPYQETPSAE